jgi:hypothetical protein
MSLLRRSAPETGSDSSRVRKGIFMLSSARYKSMVTRSGLARLSGPSRYNYQLYPAEIAPDVGNNSWLEKLKAMDNAQNN